MSDANVYLACNLKEDIHVVTKADYDKVQSELAVLREELVNQDRVLRASVPEKHKNCTSPVGAIQSYIVDLEQIVEGIDGGLILLEERDAAQACLELSISREDALIDRLTTTEQRNAELVGLLTLAIEDGDAANYFGTDLLTRIETTLNNSKELNK
jgi:hypothetical protein